MESVFVVLMRRWGNVEGHSYIKGVYPQIKLAQEAGEEETDFRGGKYSYQVFKCLFANIEKVSDTCEPQFTQKEPARGETRQA
jgi:hypothetical protein